MMQRGLPKVRQIMATISVPHVNAALAHSLLDDAIALCQSGHVRFADVHIRDTGAHQTKAKAFEDAGIYTVKDLANCCATKMPLDVFDALTVALRALRKLVDLDSERRGA